MRAYASTLIATICPRGVLLRAWKVSRRLTGRRDEPGMFAVTAVCCNYECDNSLRALYKTRATSKRVRDSDDGGPSSFTWSRDTEVVAGSCPTAFKPLLEAIQNEFGWPCETFIEICRRGEHVQNSVQFTWCVWIGKTGRSTAWARRLTA